MKRQVWVIHGGDTYDTYDDYLAALRGWTVSLEDLKQTSWKSTLGERLGTDWDVLAPRMPNSHNAKYLEWKVWFEKYVPLMAEPVILIGHSLGGTFLAKYLAETAFPHHLQATLLLAPPFQAPPGESLADFTLPASLETFAKQGGQIHLYHSEDDPVVPFGDLAKYKEALPTATVRTFTNRNHFNQPELPELVADIKALES